MNRSRLSIWGVLLACSLPMGISSAQHRSANEEFTLALTGDSIITRKLSVYDEPEYLQLIDLIRSADVAFTNLEMLLHNYEPYPMAESGGTWMRGAPQLAEELKWAGFDLLARANNHAGDYGTLGLQLTTQHVEAAGLVHAGVGKSLAAAREAKFLETSKARVALISVASSFANHMRAGRSRDNIPARPGLNPLRVKTTYVLPEAAYDSLEQTGEALGEFIDQDGIPRGRKDDSPGEMRLFRQGFARGETAKIRRVANENDIAEIASVVNNASRLADVTIVTVHSHQYDLRRDMTPEFLHLFARAMIEAGADVFVGHGPHTLRGIEIFKGKPIFYSLGDFLFQNETLDRLPADNYDALGLSDDSHVADFNGARYADDSKGFPTVPGIWEAVVAVPKFVDRQLAELALYPIDLGFGKAPQVRGRPLLANRELGEKILSDLQRLSAPYGTVIDVRRGIGYVQLNSLQLND